MVRVCFEGPAKSLAENFVNLDVVRLVHVEHAAVVRLEPVLLHLRPLHLSLVVFLSINFCALEGRARVVETAFGHRIYEGVPLAPLLPVHFRGRTLEKARISGLHLELAGTRAEGSPVG